ncbi:predicted protein [Histoplasma capsulatum var. duboisii H88]|uniref:Predicted protein n=1 Tax=Ajellomyces capsulatus (strain H88) TaxID=544711 RepID=F0U4S4_AJEC8|nr:predicted protein [Histoplasma capsulatum var. duboisii H88]
MPASHEANSSKFPNSGFDYANDVFSDPSDDNTDGTRETNNKESEDSDDSDMEIAEDDNLMTIFLLPNIMGSRRLLSMSNDSSSSQPNEMGRMLSRSSRERLDTSEARKKFLTIHADHEI